MSLGQLLELALNGNRLHLISADAFRGLEHLRILYLAGNHIARLENYTFRGLQVCEWSLFKHSPIYTMRNNFPVDWSAVNVTAYCKYADGYAHCT